MKPIYEPKGRAKEYGDYAINIYTGCPHRCYYCFAPSVLRKEREYFHNNVKPRVNIVEAIKRQIEAEKISDKLIHLCFTCDPYPLGHDSTATREAIKAIKDSGNHVQILTKNEGSRDFDLLDNDDWYGISLTGGTTKQEPKGTSPTNRLFWLAVARNKGIRTWVSFEPVINAESVLATLTAHREIFDKVKVGKLNYHPSNIDWADFGKRFEAKCRDFGIEYYIKESLRSEMQKQS